MLTEQQLHEIMPNGQSRLDAHWPYINPALETSDIKTPERIAAFLAQLAEESGEYLYMEEIADGSEYEGRRDLGNTEPGDGSRFKGHGPMQVTGRANHYLCGQALGIDLIAAPRLICTPIYGTASACWFWNRNKLSAFADLGWFKVVTKIINGGYNGLPARLAYWARARQVFGLSALDPEGETELIREFQSAAGLEVDGDAGPMTRARVISLAQLAGTIPGGM